MCKNLVSNQVINSSNNTHMHTKITFVTLALLEKLSALDLSKINGIIQAVVQSKNKDLTNDAIV